MVAISNRLHRAQKTHLAFGALSLWLTLNVQNRAHGQTSKSETDDVVEVIGGTSETDAAGGANADADVTESIGDVTESIGTEALSDRAGAADAVVTSASGGETSAQETSRTKVSGWARESLEFYPYDQNLQRQDPSDVLHVPRDRGISRTQLLIRATYQRGSSFEASVSGLLGLVEALQLVDAGQKANVESRLDARLMEGFLGFYSRYLDFRIGQQRVAWGVADIFSPNDVVNARDLRDPLLAEPEATRIPTPMARLSCYGGPLSLDLLFQPVFVPDRSDIYGRNWSAIQPDSPAYTRGLFALLAHNTDPSVQDQLNGVLFQTRLPSFGPSSLSGGAKLSYRGDGIDMNLYYHYGYDGLPYVSVDPAFASSLKSTDFAKAGLATLSPVLRAADRGLTPIVAEYIRRHHIGMDAVAPVGPFMLKLDAAYQTMRVFYKTDMTSIAKPALLAVLSLDYQTGSTGKVLVVEGVYIRVLESYGGSLLIYNRDSYGAAALLRWPLFSAFHFEARGMGGLSPRYFMAQPALIAKVGGFAIKAGASIMQGDLRSFGWLYRHNSSGFLQILYTF